MLHVLFCFLCPSIENYITFLRYIWSEVARWLAWSRLCWASEGLPLPISSAGPPLSAASAVRIAPQPERAQGNKKEQDYIKE